MARRTNRSVMCLPIPVSPCCPTSGTAQSPTPPVGFIAKLNSHGVLDTTFGTDGDGFVRSQGRSFHAFAVQPSGRIVAVGEADAGDGLRRAIVAAFTAGGAPDSTFGDSA